MPTINVDPDGLRKAGGNLNEARETLLTESNAHLLNGVGGDRHISTGGFAWGNYAQKLLGERYETAQQVLNDANQNLIALSSALYIVADVFETTDQDEALEFAFLNPDADIPAGLPSYIDPEVTSVQMREQAELQATLNGGGMPAGYTRRERNTSPYSKVIEILDENGKVVGSMQMNWYGGKTTTYTYDANEKLVGTRVELTQGNDTIVQTYSGDDTPENLTREQHQVTGDDGSTQYYTNEYDGDDEPERTDEFNVGPQSDGSTQGENLVRTIDEQEYLAETRYLRENPIGGVRPEDYQGAHNRTR
jgi:hypothetical protein